EHRPFDQPSPDGVGPIEHDKLLSLLGRRFHGESHGGKVGIEPAAYVLYVEHQDINLVQMVRRRLTCLAAEAEDLEACFLVSRVGDAVAILHSLESMLRAEERHEVDILSFMEQLGGRDAVGIAAGMIGDEA